MGIKLPPEIIDRWSRESEALVKEGILGSKPGSGLGQAFQPEDFKFFFELQGKIEKQGAMDYRQYARELWERYCGPLDNSNRENYRQMEEELIIGLHRIDMKPLVYGDIPKNLPEFVRQWKDHISKLILWSTGDVSATGYQTRKIASSRIKRSVIGALLDDLRNDEERREKVGKTLSVIADDKMKALESVWDGLVAEARAKGNRPTLRVAVVEDSPGNIEKVKKQLSDRYPQDEFEVVPFFAAYSRTGIDMKKKLPPGEYAQKMRELNGLNQFSDLLKPENMALVKDAVVLVDFDGVIGDNIRMRDEQAKVIWASVQRAKERLEKRE